MATAGLCMLALTMTASRRPRVAVCFAATTKNSNVKNYEQTPMARLSIPSTKRTASQARIYVGIDDDDILMMKWKEKIEHDATVIVTPGRKNHIPFNEITRKAYDDGADYIVRINDDTEFITEGWVKLGIAALQSMKPPNVGVVAPVCKQNTAIFTHDMVHRTHLNIFDVYYPVIFDNWYVDTWITQVYQPDRSKLVKDWEVRHHLAKTRYRVDQKQRRNLADEVERGKTKITKWVNKRTEATTSVECKKYFPMRLSSALENDLTKLLSWIRERLAPAGIDFTIACGTALGYARTQSLLPWDDDIDIAISANEMKRAQQLITDPETGFCTANLWLGFKVFFCKSPKIGKYAWGYPLIDVFSTKESGGGGIKKDTMFPSKPGVLLGVEVGTPHNLPEHLKARYKEQDAINNCYSQHYNHSTESQITDRKKYPCVDVYKQCYGIDLKGQEKRQAKSAVDAKKTVGIRLQVHVLTMNRANSLQRLLRSLENADYNNDRVHLYVHIDDSTDNKKCVEVAETFEFSHGNVVVDVAKQNNGLRDSWFKAWRPSDNERAIILEDDVELSSQWYKWLKKAWESCDRRDDLAGISLQRQTLVPKEPSAHREIVNNHEPFLYRLVGSIGFSPHWKQWRAFLEWIDSVDTSTVNIATPGLITSDWFNTLDKRHMWTQYFIWFCDQHDLYTLYVNLPGGKTLAAHMREKGKHYERTEGRDFALASEVALAFPDRFMKYDWDGKAESSKHVITTTVSSSLLNMAKNWWHYLAPYSESISVHIIGLSEGICHHFEGENLVCTYAQTTEQDYTDNEVVYRSPGYNKNVKRKLLEYSNFLENMRIGTTVLFSDVDVVYLSNPFDAITTNLNLGFSGGSQGKKCHVLLNTGVFFVVKTESNNAMFRRAIQNLERGKSYDGGDQGAIQAAVNELRLKFVRLPCDTFVNGNGLFTIKTSKNPVSIHMNWIEKSGTKRKCFEACRLWMNNTKNFIRTEATLLPSGVVRDCKKQLVTERWGGAPVHVLPSVLNDASLENVGHLKIDPKNSGRNLLNTNRETKYTSIVDMCLKGKPFGRAANQMLSIFGALPEKGTLGLDNRWSAFYADWFEPNRRINLFFKGRCKNSTNPQDAFYSLKNDDNLRNRNFEGFQMKNELLQKASGILASYDGPVATVHGRWLENECARRARTLNNWCTKKNETWEHTCHYTHSSVFKLLPADIKHVLYISDGQTPKYAKTFKKVDSHAFNIQFAMMSLSDYHFGNPMSTIDYIVSKLRQNKLTYPERCYATSFEAGVERKTNSNDKSWVIVLTVNAGYIDLFLNFFHWLA